MLNSPLFPSISANALKATLVFGSLGLLLSNTMIGIFLNTTIRPTEGPWRVIWSLGQAYLSFYFLVLFCSCLFISFIWKPSDDRADRPTDGTIFIPPFWFALAALIAFATPRPISKGIVTFLDGSYAHAALLALAVAVPALVYFCMTMGYQTYLAYRDAQLSPADAAR